MSEPKELTIYTRGIGTPSGGAYVALLVYGAHRRELSGWENGASSNRMELCAAVEALRALKWPCRVILYNASGYLSESMSKGWAAQWRKAGWFTGKGKPTSNADLWDALLNLCTVHSVEFVWIPAEGVDQFAYCKRIARQIIQEHAVRAADRRTKLKDEPDPADM